MKTNKAWVKLFGVVGCWCVSWSWVFAALFCFVLFMCLRECFCSRERERERERTRVLGFCGGEWRPRAGGRWMTRAKVGGGGGVESVSSWRHQMMCLVLSLLGGDWWRFFLLRFLFCFYLLININVFENKFYFYFLSNQILKRANNIWHLE